LWHTGRGHFSTLQRAHQDTPPRISHDPLNARVNACLRIERQGVQEEIMTTNDQRSTVTSRRPDRLAVVAIVSLGICTSAFGQSSFPAADGPDATHEAVVAPFGAAAIDEAVRRTTAASLAWNGRTRYGSPSDRRLGAWAVGPGLIVGAMLGAAVDCLMTTCGRGTPNIPTGVFPGMVAGAAITAYAPRRVAGSFLGVGAGMLAGGGVGGAIQGDCSPNHPCREGVAAGAAVGAAAGGFVGFRLAGR
jgi:hypothetical protein